MVASVGKSGIDFAMLDRIRKLDAPFSSTVPRLTTLLAWGFAVFALVMAIRARVAYAQLSPTDKDIELIESQGFETYAAWIMLVVVLGLLGFIVRRFGKIIDNEREDRNGILHSLAKNMLGCGESIVLLQKEIVEQRRDSTVQRGRLEEQIKESRSYYAEALDRFTDKLADIDRRLEAIEKNTDA